MLLHYKSKSQTWQTGKVPNKKKIVILTLINKKYRNVKIRMGISIQCRGTKSCSFDRNNIIQQPEICDFLFKKKIFYNFSN